MDANKGKTGKASGVETLDEESVKATTGLSKEQVSELLQVVMAGTGTVAATLGRNAAVEFLASARPDMDKAAEEIANKAVSQALARQQKSSALKVYGTTAAVSAGVFVAGTLAMIGIDRYKHRNDQRSRDMNPQYQPLSQT